MTNLLKFVAVRIACSVIVVVVVNLHLHPCFSCVYRAVVFVFVAISFSRSFAILLIYSRTESVKTIKSECYSYLFNRILSAPNIFYQPAIHDFILNAKLLIYPSLALSNFLCVFAWKLNVHAIEYLSVSHFFSQFFFASKDKY